MLPMSMLLNVAHKYVIECCVRVYVPNEGVTDLLRANCRFVMVVQIIMQLFNWTRDPRRVATIRQRKDELYDELMNGVQPAEVVGSRAFFDTLRNYKVCGGAVRCGILLLQDWQQGTGMRAAYAHACMPATVPSKACYHSQLL